MQFQTQQKRVIWRSFAIGLLLDVAIALMLVHFLLGKDEGSALLAFGLCFVAIQVLSVAVALRGTVAFWVGQWLGGSKALENAFYSSLVEGGYPKPDEFEVSAESYLGRMADDEELNPLIRVRAGILLGTITGLAQRGISVAAATGVAMEQAIRHYSER